LFRGVIHCRRLAGEDGTQDTGGQMSIRTKSLAQCLAGDSECTSTDGNGGCVLRNGSVAHLRGGDARELRPFTGPSALIEVRENGLLAS
jgi:hypothetical protein